jgi:uncharacterized phage-like protein YoqJ
MNEKEISVAFTGHRVLPYERRMEARERLKYAILQKYHEGFRVFYSGMARGFDLLAAEAVLHIRETYRDIRLVAVVPYRRQPERFSDYDKQRYANILSRADRVELLSEEYYDGCLLRRNDYMLNRTSALIAWYDGMPSGGTAYTFRRALAAQKHIINIF